MQHTRGEGVSPKRRRIMISVAVAAGAVATPASSAAASASSAADASAVADGKLQVQDRVVITGSRTETRASKSLTPINVIGGDQLRATGQTTLRDSLVKLSPSITRTSYSGDAGVLTDTLSLHGLTPDHVLGLVNGKRRHSIANITLDPGLNQGSTGVDINTMPVGLIDHIEVLRDGAFAQYGSDAIGCVINIILKRKHARQRARDDQRTDVLGGRLQDERIRDDQPEHRRKGFLDLSAGSDRRNHTIRTGHDDYFGGFP